jgi:hypothetical protein
MRKVRLLLKRKEHPPWRPFSSLSLPGAWQFRAMAENDVPRVELTTDTGVGLFEIMTLHSRLGGSRLKLKLK